ncbi:MAG: DUF1552 domain-containing protein [Planctomycetota bacterium]|nr:DUF1552 domain-containing protein [Planctomycetota bacterium]
MHQPLKRRTFLKATGVSLALPLLETMSPALGSAPAAAPKRMVCICTTLGLHPPSLWPRTPGAGYESTEYLDLLKDHRKDFTLFSGLEHEGQSGRQPHNCELTWLTAARGPGLGGFRNTVSIDQYAAGKLGYVTRFPSVVLSSNSKQSQSFTSSGVMVPAENSPAKLFSKMFLKGNARQVEKQKRQLSDGRSILDSLRSQAKNLQRETSRSDNRQLDEYYESIRKAEKDLAEVQAWMTRPKPKVEAPPPDDIRDKRNLVGRTQLLMNMVPLILQTDSSRVVAVMVQDHYSVPQVDGVSLEHHNLSHHGRDKAKIVQLKKIESALVNCFGSLLAQLKAKKEGTGTLLGNTSVLFGSNLGNANSHDPRNLPIFLAGGGFRHGSYVARKKGDTAPLCNLFVSMLNKMGLETESFAQSKGSLSW